MSEKNIRQNKKRGSKLITKLLLLAVMCAVVYVGYIFFEIKREIFKVYTTKPEYMATTPHADLIIVEFSDYTCEWCRKLHPILQDAIKKDGKITYIPRPVAYGDPWKARLVSAVYAAAMQGKAVEMHDAIYKFWPIMDDGKLFDVAKELKLDVNKFSRDLRSDEARVAIVDNERFFDAWGLVTAPALLVGDSFIYIPNGAMPTVDELLEKFEDAR